MADDMSLYLEIGARLRSLRKKQHLTQHELAKLTGLSTSFLGHVERGTRILSIATLLRLCQALHTTPNTLLAMPEDSATAFCQEAAACLLELMRQHNIPM